MLLTYAGDVDMIYLASHESNLFIAVKENYGFN